MKLSILKDFEYFHAGVNRVKYTEGDEIDATDNEMIVVAKSEGWARVSGEKASKPPRNKAIKAAPENK